MSFGTLKDKFSSFAAGERKTSGSGFSGASTATAANQSRNDGFANPSGRESNSRADNFFQSPSNGGNGRSQVTGVTGEQNFVPEREEDENAKREALIAASKRSQDDGYISDFKIPRTELPKHSISESEIERAIITWKRLSNDSSPEISGPAKLALNNAMQRFGRREEIDYHQVDLTFVDNEARAYANRLENTIERARKIYTDEQESLDKKRRLAYKDFRTQVFGDKTDKNPANDDGDTLAKTFHYGSMVLSILSWCALAYTLCKALTLPWYIAGLLMLAVGYLGKAFSDGRLKMIFNNQRLAEGETSTKQKIKSAMMTLADILLEVAGIPALLALVVNSNVATNWQTILSSVLGVLFVEYMYYRINSQIAKDCLRDFNESVKKIVIHKNRVRDLLRAYDQYLVKMTERGQQVVRRGVRIINNLFEEKTGLV